MNLKTVLTSALLLTERDLQETRLQPPRETVVLLHGWWSNPLALTRLHWRLRAAGYRVVNRGYRSIRVPLQEVAEHRLPKALARKIPSNTPRVHFVTHSMGALLLREFLARHPQKNLGRIVMLGPPNQGSELADGFHLEITKWLAGPNHRYLPTDSLLLNSLPVPEAEIGVIAGNRALLPARRLPLPHDGKVSVARTHIAGQADHQVVPVPHSLIPWSSKVIELTVSFLATGKFEARMDTNTRSTNGH